MERLTRQQRRVVALLAKSNQDIATELHISMHTVKIHVANIYRRLGVDSRLRAYLLFLKGEI